MFREMVVQKRGSWAGEGAPHHQLYHLEEVKNHSGAWAVALSVFLFCFIVLPTQTSSSVSLTGDEAECGWQGTVKCDLFSCSLEFLLLSSSGWCMLVEVDMRGLVGLFAQVFLFLLPSAWPALPNSSPLSDKKKAAELGRSQANLREFTAGDEYI